ncbi:MAG: aminoglycoside phosphotransferase family protein [Acidobacteriia bacterium]|nr:aminoglycoside phosphotransferase family protein [Terriglobia bacterium]
MGREGTRQDRRAWKQNQEAVFGNPDFVHERILGLLPEVAGGGARPEWRFEVIRNKAAGRSTLLYSIGGSARIYGKAYFDFAAAAEAHRSLTHLWAHGFASGSFLEVPEPLGIIPEANLVLMRSADGVPMDQRAGSVSLEAALTDARLAARWLVKYQNTAIPGLRAESPCEKLEILKIADAVAKVAAECPEHSSLLIDMIHDLRAVTPKSNTSPQVTPMHGQFRPAHVFIEGSRATVIDVEKLCLSDPAKDVARFCHVLKKTCLEERGDLERADRVAQEFVAEYRAHNKANLENLAYFRALLAFKALAKLLKNRKVDEAQRESMGRAYQAEFERWVRNGTISEMAA